MLRFMARVAIVLAVVVLIALVGVVAADPDRPPKQEVYYQTEVIGASRSDSELSGP